jgi:hypothetical protein
MSSSFSASYDVWQEEKRKIRNKKNMYRITINLKKAMMHKVHHYYE